MPEIKPIKELRFRSPNLKLALRSQMFRPATNSDFVSTQGTAKRDIGFFPIGTPASGAGIAANAFYVGASVVRDFQLGDDLYILNSAHKDVIIVHLDGPTTVS